MIAKSEQEFNEEYKNLNKAQKEAVDTIDGPVMVVAGPGTGKTQILALRIGNILLQTDTQADGILCLTFTNSAVRAMKERLRKYIGPEASKVKVSTFHSFGLDILDKYFTVLGLGEKPTLMDEKDSIALYDDVLQKNDWEFIRPRADSSRYFKDLKSLISFLKRERLTPEKFEEEIKKEIENIREDPSSISSRGESKGKMKKEIERRLEGLFRTLEAVKFYELCEKEKKSKNLFDYDDILEALVFIVEESEEARNYIKENFLYILIDEHQDSSGVQNEFLEKVWKGEEKPNIFVVGDDRQLIYGFGGASLEYFENFKNMFGRAELITLEENYRSTQKILDSAHNLLQSSISKGKLKSNHKEDHPLRLIEANYPRDEIIFSALEIKEKIEKSHDINDIAILVPKNYQVRSAVTILKDLGVPVAGGNKINFFEIEEAQSFLKILKIMANPSDGVYLSSSFFDKHSLVSPLSAHRFLKENKMRDFSLLSAVEEKNSLFDNEKEVNIWLQKLKSWLSFSNLPLYSFIQKIGTEFLLDTAKSHQGLVTRIEVLRTMLHLALMQIEKNSKINLAGFLEFLERIEAYGENIPLAIFAPNEGVKVLTLHGSKGLEFDYVWIAHMDERSFSGSKREGFSLPLSIKERLEKRDEMVLKRELYVAITRAKRFCTVSYALNSYTGVDQELAHVVADLQDSFEKQTAEETEKIILSKDKKVFVEKQAKDKDKENGGLKDLIKLVARDYEDRKVSVSLLNNFFECPWKWYFRNLLQLPELKSESLEFGNAVHGAIDQILKLKKIPSEAELQKITNEDKEVLSVISRWVKDRLDSIEKNRETEQPISLNDKRFPHLNIYGKIDLIEHLDALNLRVTDFKTGSVRKKGEIEKIDEEGRMSTYLRQLSMYSYLINESPKWQTNVKESRLEFLETKNKAEAFYDTEIKEEQIEMLVKDISDYDKLVKGGEWINRSCHYNSYGKNTICEYCQMAKIYKS
jgi:DNA helicase-2/ATP-dependent DNA helicase PcrA